MSRGWARTLVCAWLLWQSFYANHELVFVQLKGPLAAPDCLREVAAKAPYEKQVGLMQGYQEITLAMRQLHPEGVWYICYPEEYDPRGQKGSKATVTPK
jgi:hypothetical protein